MKNLPAVSDFNSNLCWDKIFATKYHLKASAYIRSSITCSHFAYRCSPLPVSDKCINVQDPNDACCEVQVCDVSHDVHEEPENATSSTSTTTSTTTTTPIKTTPINIISTTEVSTIIFLKP